MVGSVCTYNYEGTRWFFQMHVHYVKHLQRNQKRKKRFTTRRNRKMFRFLPELISLVRFVSVAPPSEPNESGRTHTHTHRSPINLFHFDFNRFMGKSFTLPMFKFSWRCALRFWHTHKHTHRIWRCMREKRVFPHARAHSFVCTLCQILLDICYMRI